MVLNTFLCPRATWEVLFSGVAQLASRYLLDVPESFLVSKGKHWYTCKTSASLVLARGAGVSLGQVMPGLCLASVVSGHTQHLLAALGSV